MTRLPPTATVKVTVRAAAANPPPVANAGANQNITLPVNTATLDGTASVDPNGAITGYVWAKISGPAQGAISTPGKATTSVSNLIQGNYSYVLTVTDNNGLTATDTVTIVVNATGNIGPDANAGPGKTIGLPVNSVSFDGSQSSDPGGSIVSYNWVQVSGPSRTTVANSNTVSPTVSGVVAGDYIFQLTVTDNNGATDKAQVKLVVSPAVNQPPVANAGVDQSITLPTNTVTLDGSKSADADGSLASYSWIKASGTGGTITSMQARLNQQLAVYRPAPIFFNSPLPIIAAQLPLIMLSLL